MPRARRRRSLIAEEKRVPDLSCGGVPVFRRPGEDSRIWTCASPCNVVCDVCPSKIFLLLFPLRASPLLSIDVMPDDPSDPATNPPRSKQPRASTTLRSRTSPPPNDQDARPPTKRARKAINCEPCRNSKLKCDRNRPCSSCVLRGTIALCYQDARAHESDIQPRNEDQCVSFSALVPSPLSLPAMLAELTQCKKSSV